MRSIDDAIDQASLHDDAEQEERGRAEHESDVGIDAGLRREKVGEVHPPYHHVAVREIDDAHDAEDEREPHGHEAVDTAEEDPADQPLEDEGRIHVRSPERIARAQPALGTRGRTFVLFARLSTSEATCSRCVV